MKSKGVLVSNIAIVTFATVYICRSFNIASEKDIPFQAKLHLCVEFFDLNEFYDFQEFPAHA